MMSFEIGTFAGVDDILRCSLGIIYRSWIEADTDNRSRVFIRAFQS